MSRQPLHSLPLAPPSARLTAALQPVPTSSSFGALLDRNPSALRRSQVFPTGHFAHVTPLPVEFPYRLPVRLNDEGEREPAVNVEQWLSSFEPTVKQDRSSSTSPAVEGHVYSNAKRAWPTTLLALSQPCLDQVLPHLDPGDAAAVTARDLPEGGADELEPDDARNALIGMLGGREVRMDLDDEEGGLKPWSLRYGGRQFGSWASQVRRPFVSLGGARS